MYMIIIPEIYVLISRRHILKVLFRLISLVLCLSIHPEKFFLDIRDRRGEKLREWMIILYVSESWLRSFVDI